MARFRRLIHWTPLDDGYRIDTPPLHQADRTFKKAPRAVGPNGQTSLLAADD